MNRINSKLKKISVSFGVLIFSSFLLFLTLLCFASYAKDFKNFYREGGLNSAKTAVLRLPSTLEKKMSGVDSAIAYYTLNDIVSTQVFKGNGNWLFYKSETDGNTIADYEGTNLFSEQETEEICSIMKQLQEILISDYHADFSVLLCPNKETVYSAFMPEEYTKAETSQADYIYEKLEQADVKTVWVKDALCNYSGADPLYYYYDTHWNELGGYLAVQELLKKWNIQLPELSDLTIGKEYLRESSYSLYGQDDLAELAGLRELVFNDDERIFIKEMPEIDWRRYWNEYEQGKAVHFHNENALENSSLIIVGDSFRSYTIPALSYAFSDIYVVHKKDCSKSTFDSIDPDYVIVEFVERYIGEMNKITSIVS